MKEVPDKITNLFSFHQQTLTVQQPHSNTQKAVEALKPAIKVIAAKPLTNPVPYCSKLAGGRRDD